MIRLLITLCVFLLQVFRKTEADLRIENLALRQQLAVFKHKHPRPKLTNGDRSFWLALREHWCHWSNVLVVVKPETVVNWHRQGFKRYWRWKSRPKKIGRPNIKREVRELVRKMAMENQWGAPKIHAELLKLGFDVSERTVSRYLPKKPVPPDAVKRWIAFLKNHRELITGVDFFTVPTALFTVQYVFFVISHHRREILHFGIHTQPWAEWVINHLRQACPHDERPRYLVLDRDGKYGDLVPATLKSWGIKPIRISPRKPWQNGVAERWVLSAKKEMLDHVVVLNEAHLHRLMRDYIRYYNEDRCHLSVEKDSPLGRSVTPKPSAKAKVISLSRIGGLAHKYEWRDAA